ncbi:uncharacterized protein [Littorina saxatilis]|uniref:uncharacterized protein n=1 Tax=Littorina saxatilis TaxID=31220 RepID=UPI0038B4A180
MDRKLPEETQTLSHSTGLSPMITTMSSFPESEGLDTYQFLHAKDIQFVTSLTPTLAYIILMMLSGLVGNTIVFFVYYRRFKPSVTRTFVLAMSVVDLLTNVLSLPADIFEIRFHNTFESIWACKLSRTVKSFLSFMSACILVAVAIDRFRKMCKPYSKPTTCKHVRIILALCAAVAICITLPYIVLTGCQTVQFQGTNITGHKCSIDDVYVKSSFLNIYNVITGVTFIVCVIIMTVCYVRIARQLWLHKQQSGVSVTGRAVSWRGEGHGSRANLQEFHTYTDEETSPEKLDHSINDMRYTSESSDRPAKSSESYAYDKTLSNASKSGVYGQTAESNEASDTPSAKVEATSDQSLNNPSSCLKCDAELSTGHDDSTEVASDCKSSSVGIRSGTNTADRTSHPLNNNTAVPPKIVCATDPEDIGECASEIAVDSTKRIADDTMIQIQMNVNHTGNLPTENDRHMPIIFITNASGDCSASPLAAPNHAGNSEKVTPGNGGLEVQASSSKPHKLSVLAGSITSSFRRLRNDSKLSLTGKKSIPRFRGSVRKIPTRTTLMMFVLTAIFIVNYLPYLVIVSSRVHVELLVEKLGLNVYHIVIRSYFINSAVNPLVYSFCSARFRQECSRLFNCK